MDKKNIKTFRKSKKKLFRGGAHSINPFLELSINSNEISVPYNIPSIMQQFSKFEKNWQWIKILADYNKEIKLLSGLFSLCVVGYIVKQKIDNNILSKKLTKSKKALKNSKKAIMQIRNEHTELTELYKFNTAINKNISPYISSLYGILSPLTQHMTINDCKLTYEQRITKCVCYKNQTM